MTDDRDLYLLALAGLVVSSDWTEFIAEDNMKNQLRTTKLRVRTLEKLRLLKGYMPDMPGVDIVDLLITQELMRRDPQVADYLKQEDLLADATAARTDS